MLMKWTQCVILTNFLHAAFSYESVVCSFSIFTICVCNLFEKWKLAKKAERKMLMKLTQGGRGAKFNI